MKKWLEKYAPKAKNGIEGTMDGLTDKGFDYNGAWGGTMQMGGSIISKKYENAKLEGESKGSNVILKLGDKDFEKVNNGQNREEAKKNQAYKNTIEVENINDPRLRAYNDSLTLWKNSQALTKKYKKSWGETDHIHIVPLSEIDKKNYQKSISKQVYRADNPKLRNKTFINDGDISVLQYNKNIAPVAYLSNHPTELWEPTQLNKDEIQRRSYYSGNTLPFFPVYKKPVQPVVYKKPESFLTKTPNVTKEKQQVIPKPLQPVLNPSEIAVPKMNPIGDWNAIWADERGNQQQMSFENEQDYLNFLNKQKHYDIQREGQYGVPGKEGYRKEVLLRRPPIMELGGSLPGAVGFTYTRTSGAAPSNGKYAKKTTASAQNGAEMKYYQEGLDFKPKTISQDGVAIDPEGYWNPENWGNPVIIPSNVITMKGVDQPLIGISDTGEVQYMEPGEDYEFNGEYVTEYPVAKNGINQVDAQPVKKLDQLLNFTNYNKPTKGGWLDKYN